MDFSEVDIREILFAAIPLRFQDFSPTDFEDFIAQLFRDMGFDVEQTKYSGDFGADLLTSKGSERGVVQIKRYAEDNKVSVADVNQVLGAKDYYDADVAIMVTTSSLTKPALKLCEKADVSVWDWDVIKITLFTTYFDGLDYYTYFENRLKSKDALSSHSNLEADSEMKLEELFQFRLAEFRTDLEMDGRSSFGVNVILLEATNVSHDNLSLQILLPVYITHEHRQIEPVGVSSDHFISGTVYAGTTVTIGFMFPADRLPKIVVGDRIILEMTLDGETMTRHFVDVESLEGLKFQGSGASQSSGMCFVATSLFGCGAPEYSELTWLRDQVLNKHSIGRGFIGWYYQVGPWVVQRLERSVALRDIARTLIRALLVPVRLINRYYR